MPKPRKRKNTGFESSLTRSVFYYGHPNTGKSARLEKIQSLYCDIVNEDIRIILEHGFFMQLVKNDKKDPEVRAFEKSVRRSGLNSAFCQNAFDDAFTLLSNRLNDIRFDMAAFGNFAMSKVLFALCLEGRSRVDACAEMAALYMKTKTFFHLECASMLDDMTDDEYSFLMLEFRDMFEMACLSRKVPVLSRADVPLDSRLMTLERSDNIAEPYVISITDPENRGQRIVVPIRLSSDAERRLSQYEPAASVRFSIRRGVLKVARAFEKKVTQPKTSKTVGVDTGIIDSFHTSDGQVIGTMKKVLDFYRNTVEPAFAYLSDLRNKKRNISHYLHAHAGTLPADVKRSLIAKMDKLEHMIREADAPYRKQRHYYQMLDKEIRDSVDAYIKGCNSDVLTVLELLDIKEFNKSRKANGMMSTFARGSLQKKLMEELNWHGFDFLEVAPDYTSKTCPVCSNLDDANRNGKKFHCTCCGYTDDADHVGALNIKSRADDEEVLSICSENRYNHTKMQSEIRRVFAGRNAKYRSAHPLIRSA